MTTTNNQETNFIKKKKENKKLLFFIEMHKFIMQQLARGAERGCDTINRIFVQLCLSH